jgi:hypothetical protein
VVSSELEQSTIPVDVGRSLDATWCCPDGSDRSGGERIALGIDADDVVDGRYLRRIKSLAGAMAVVVSDFSTGQERSRAVL